MQGANGMYLWAWIMANEVRRVPMAENELVEELNDLPRGLADLYDNILGKFQQIAGRRGFVESVLFWATFCGEAFKPEELKVGIAMRAIYAKNTLIPGTENFKVSEEDIEKAIPLSDIKITVAAYLLQPLFEDSGKPFNPNSTGPQDWEKKVLGRIEKHKFLSYAALNWIHHIRSSGKPSRVSDNPDHYSPLLIDLSNHQAINWGEVWWYYRKCRPEWRRHPENDFHFEKVLEFFDSNCPGKARCKSPQIKARPNSPQIKAGRESPQIKVRRPPFLYKPLVGLHHEIRLLSILPATAKSPISCIIETVPLHGPGGYTALSYCWGDRQAIIDIIINDAQLAVTASLHEALWSLRKETELVRVWADAICINQEDRQERSLQVQLMKKIYLKAEKVIAWVSSESVLSTAAISLLKEKATDMESQSGPLLHPSNNYSEILKNFFQLPYWKRIWIIQEIAVGSVVYVRCGNHMMQWEDLGSLDQFMHPENQPNHVKQLRKFRTVFQSDGQISLLEAMFASREALATDLRDKVFALLGLCYDADRLVPAPNYEQSLKEILRDLTIAIIAKTRCLDYILFNTRHEMEESSSSSWQLDWIGYRSDPKELLSAQPKKSDLYYLGKAQHPDILCVRGHILGTVTSFDNIKTPTHDGTSPTDFSYEKYTIEAIFESLCLRSLSEDELFHVKNFFSTLWVENGRVAPNRRDQVLRYMQERDISSAAPLGLAFEKRPSTIFGISQDGAAAIQGALRYQEHQFINWLEGNQELATIRSFLKELQTSGSFTDMLGLFRNLFIRTTNIAELEFKIIQSLQIFAQHQMKLLCTIDGAIYVGHALTIPGDIICQLNGFTKLVVLRPKSNFGGPIFKVVGGAEKYRLTTTDHEVEKPPSLFLLT